MSKLDKNNYVRTLFERLHEGIVVPLKIVKIEIEDGIWQPEAQQCHNNALILEKTYPNDLEVVRGWLVFDFRDAFGQIQFMHHSVVKEKKTGRLFDPTPQERLNPNYLFIEAKLLETDYADLVESMAIGELLTCKTTQLP